MKKFQKIGSLVLAMVMALSMGSSAFASAIEQSEDLNARVLQFLLVSEEGCYLYTGAEAQEAFSDYNAGVLETDYSHIIPSTEVESSIESQKILDTSDDYEIEPNSFHYRYRFVPDSNNGKKVYGNQEIISDTYVNRTSVEQSMQASYTATASGSINSGLNGKFLDAVEAEIGTQYTEEYSVSYSLTVNVAPKTRVWLQYKPEYTHYSGEAQKYYITRYSDTLIVEQTQDVDILEASERRVPLLGNKTVPAGAYTWCEDDDYLDQTPPRVQN